MLNWNYFCYLTVCKDRMKTRTCQYFVRLYRARSIDVCTWKHMTTNCALTCKVCGKILKKKVIKVIRTIVEIVLINIWAH